MSLEGKVDSEAVIAVLQQLVGERLYDLQMGYLFFSSESQGVFLKWVKKDLEVLQNMLKAGVDSYDGDVNTAYHHKLFKGWGESDGC